MPSLTSKFGTGLENLSVDLDLCTRIELGKPNPNNPRLWVTYFLGPDPDKGEKIVRTWFYKSEQDRSTELKRIQEKFPKLMTA